MDIKFFVNGIDMVFRETLGSIQESGNSGLFMPDNGTVDEAWCGVCRSKMKVTRNCHGPTNFVSAISRNPKAMRDYDSFSCPHYEEAWHLQVAELKQMVRDTASLKLAMMFIDEINEILMRREATKEWNPYS